MNDFNSTLLECSEKCLELTEPFIKVSFIDRLVGRTLRHKAESHCHLNCIKNLSLENIKRNGRWAFLSIFGFTEFFSSIFALISLFYNISGFYKIREKVSKSPLSTAIQIHLISGNAAFMSSFLFHFHETTFTRNADYFTAIFSIFIGTAVAFLRVILIYDPSNFKMWNKKILSWGCVLFLSHIYYMLLVDFDYVFNKIVCGILFIITFGSHFITYYYYRNNPVGTHMITFLYSMVMACIFEISDTPPIFYVLDSHAMWHFFALVAVTPFIEFTAADIDFHMCLNK